MLRVISVCTFLSVATLVLLLASCGNPTYRSVPTLRIPPGMRAVSILVHQDISVTSGDHVDVLIIGKGQESTTVLQDVEVVAVDDRVRSVTFFVSPDDARRAMDASEKGQFNLRLWKSN
ncbi:MAG: RcpC/CpaB family pilus assembly protein [Candidatus Sulfotelmatobacter sp.]